MVVMPANNTCWLVHYWAGRYGGLGHLLSPARKETLVPHLPRALDNGAYSAFIRSLKSGVLSIFEWDAAAFIAHCERYAFAPEFLRPIWVVCPDMVGDAAGTLYLWECWAEWIRDELHLPVALAVQDGMTVEMVKALRIQPDVIFVGGTTEWKWSTYAIWAANFPRVHVGRVNGIDGLNKCEEAGVESVDGTGWFRGRPAQILELGYFLAKQAGFPRDPDVATMVRYSRLKGREQGCLPLPEVVHA